MTAAALRALEKQNIERALACAQGKVHGPNGAAELLGIKATTLASRIKALDIKRR